MRTISLIKSDNFTEDFYKNYSVFKHGSKRVARQFGFEVGDVCEFPENSHLIIYPAPYSNVVTASSSFKDYLLARCTKQFMNKNITVRQSKVDRKYSYSSDYGKMNAAERAKAISSDIFYIDKNFINEQDILVFIDDIKITGSHEKRIIEVLEREDIKNDVIFIYIAEYTGNNPAVEHELNHRSVNSLKDVNYIIRNDEFLFNTRVIKYILAADIEHFVSFITYQSVPFCETLFALSVLNNYHTNSKYSTNFNILKDFLKKL